MRDEGTLPSRLAARLAAAGRPCRVINGAQLGSVSGQDLLSLMLWLQGGRRPAVVVMMPGFNDVFSAELNGRAGLPHKEWHRRSEFNIQLSQRRLLAALLRNSGLGRLILGYETEAPDRRVVRPDTDALAERTAAILDVNLRCARALAAEFGCHLLAFWHPHLFAKQTPTPYERVWRDSIAFGRPLYEAVERRLPRDGTLTDLGGLFAADIGPTFLDYAHPGEIANDRLAHVIADHVLRSLGSIPVAKETVPC
ncbi:MAG: hypothetical protein F8N37_04655 [Telmatospirillum sp.]|nr:hypothetical protein [Telmatospirillum sp.]